VLTERAEACLRLVVTKRREKAERGPAAAASPAAPIIAPTAAAAAAGTRFAKGTYALQDDAADGAAGVLDLLLLVLHDVAAACSVWVVVEGGAEGARRGGRG
jgi:hypothetical protein